LAMRDRLRFAALIGKTAKIGEGFPA